MVIYSGDCLVTEGDRRRRAEWISFVLSPPPTSNGRSFNFCESSSIRVRAVVECL